VVGTKRMEAFEGVVNLFPEMGNALTIDEQKAKLALIVEVAREVWGG
jgi:hypothetical protein